MIISNDDVTWLSVTPTPSSVDEISGPNEVKVYPNPAKENAIFSTNITEGLIHLLDAAGRLVLTESISGNLTPVDVTPFKSGIYAYQVFGPNGNVISKGKLSVE